ncbi:hypothetical protein MFLO_08377 [Listeria floridensis FSL S10-1187]|uniref:Uncharacterized protein n=1 Tax=Listeria floridensis FSL S10-1187 TaxID=1265817 RepID=A0ABP3AZT5_9LIST|nr:hypothetical protein [Listeria floridensis]EUJ31811.1 hypothetical protein MFLO_08377 [Listeria floridensis FSL S10-1187]
MGILAQMFAEPEFISISVTFLLTLAIFRFWPVITLLKPAMVTRTHDTIRLFRLTPCKITISKPTRTSFVVNWIVATLKKGQFDDDENHSSYSLSELK